MITRHSIGKPKDKSFFNIKKSFAVLGSLICLFVAVVAVAPWTIIPRRLGYTVQVQVLGVLLSVINKCFLVVSPKFFFAMECR